MSTRNLGPYRVDRELGRGGSGVVYLAEDTRLSRRVALKVFPCGLDDNGWLRAKIRREVDLASRMSDPGICAIHDAGVDGGNAYIAMRHVEGESLARWGEREHPLEEVLALVEQVARTVHRAHEAGVVHGDLKPSNVMVTPDGRPVILDFGSAHDLERASPGDFRGTPAYAAPEQIQHTLGMPDRRSDVFALGVILYESLTGVRPFAGSNPESVFRAVLGHTPLSPRSLNPDVSRDLEAVVTTALAKSQDERYQTARDLAEDLRRVREHEPISVHRAGLWTRYHRWTKRRPTLAGGLSLLLIVLAAGVGLSAWFLARDHRALASVRRISAERALANLARSAGEDPWPRLARGVAAMDAWLAEAEALLERAGNASPAGARTSLELESFPSTVESVRERRREAAGLAARTIDAHREAWDEVVAALADAGRNPHYGGIRMIPQEGLVPLGQDPRSRLFEFAHVQSGAVPERDPATGQLLVDAGSALVLVLVPGGRFRMGAVPPGPDHPEGTPNVDPQAGPDEAPVHAVRLDPFFISKYMTSCAQWTRLGGRAPDQDRYWMPLQYTRVDGQTATVDPASMHVGSIGWSTAKALLARFGLTLPTEAQMEYAIRAGTSTVWYTGNDPAAFRAEGSIASQAPVFEGRPNPFGFVHLHGIAQLLLDWSGSYELPVRPGDGLRLVEGGTLHAGRGGNPNAIATWRSSSRHTADWGGLRPARALDP